MMPVVIILKMISVNKLNVPHEWKLMQFYEEVRFKVDLFPFNITANTWSLLLSYRFIIY